MTCSYLEKSLKTNSSVRRRSIRSSYVGKLGKTFTSLLKSIRTFSVSTKMHRVVKATAGVRTRKRRKTKAKKRRRKTRSS